MCDVQRVAIRDIATAIAALAERLGPVEVLEYSPLPAREFMKPILETSAINPYPLRAGVGISFAGEVAYARMLHEELRDRGVHVAHTAIGGRIAPGADHEPGDVAELLWRHHTERGDFQARLGID